MFNSGIKVNPKQKTILFDAMSRHRHLLERQSASLAVRRSKSVVWEKLAAQLNKYGPEKDIAQWKKCWRDLRLATRKKYLKAKKYKNTKYILDDYERLVIRACGMQFNENEESGELMNAIDEDDAENIEDEETNDEPDDEKVPTGFEIVSVPSEEITSEEDLMRGTIKIEDVPLSPRELASVSESLFLSRESLTLGLKSICSSQTTTTSNFNTPATSDSKDATIIEIRKMHRNLLSESRKQTALLRKLLNRLSQ